VSSEVPIGSSLSTRVYDEIGLDGQSIKLEGNLGDVLGESNLSLKFMRRCCPLWMRLASC